MCGISGFCKAPGDDFSAARLGRELLLAIENRGGDATGYAYRVARQPANIFGCKADMTASRFVDANDFQVDPEATVFIGHTRMMTHGTFLKNENNHPIHVANIVGVHNGMVWNHNDLFKLMDIEHRRIGEVDSEAIFAALAYGAELMDDNKARLGHTIPSILEEIEASMAIAWLNGDDDSDILHLAKGAGSPLWIGETHGGSLVFASTQLALTSACKRADVNLVSTHEVELGRYLVIVAGQLQSSTTFEPAITYSAKPTTTYWGPTPDQGSRYDYQSWWKDNTKTVVKATSPKDAAVAVVGTATETAKCYRCETLEDALGWKSELSGNLRSELAAIFNIECLPEIDGLAYDDAYLEREDDITRFYDGLSGNRLDTLRECGSTYRPGDWVTTDCAGSSQDAQILHLPDQFPSGAYILRVLIPNPAFGTGWEPVLVSRFVHEFQPATSYGSVATVDLAI